MKKIVKRMEVKMELVKLSALKREAAIQGFKVEGDSGYTSLDINGFQPGERVEVGSKVLEREEYVNEDDAGGCESGGVSSGAVSNAYRSGWDAVFGKPRAKA